MQSPDIQARIALWRQKALEGTLTQDDMKEAIAVLRADRIRASETSSTSRTAKGASRTAKSAINSNDLLSELEGL